MPREPLVPHDASQTIAAGGIAAIRAKLAGDQRSSPVTARAYPHPALDGKVVIRLEPDAVAAGTDAEMAAFGFGAPKVSSALGQVRFRTLGFPAWALVHEPKKAAAALAVTDAMRKAKRLVAAKPGHAKAAFEVIAKTLSKGTPQFLPSFWEEVGRVVADQGSSTMAAQCFERARQAERAYKLKTNAEDSDAVFVEFALLGALSAKTLSQYAKDLAKAAGGKEAYRRFRAIVVKRALGGMPPYSGMGKDLQALAKGAGLGVDAEADALVAELIEAPGAGKAPTEFWTTYREALVRVGLARPAVRTRVRALWPDPRGGTDETKKAFKSEAWIQVLDDVGALADVPDDGLGAWMSRLIRYAGKTARVESLLREMAPRLIALKQPISVDAARPRWGSDLHLDLAELALELGIPLVDPAADDSFFPESMSVDPVRVAADHRYGKKLVEAVAGMIGEAEHEHRMRGKAGFATARRTWLADRIDTLERHPLASVATTLETLEGKTTAETFLPYPDLYARLGGLDLAGALAAQLGGGLADELGWPAFETAVATLSNAGTSAVGIGGAFPVCCVWNATRVIAVDHTGVVAEHDFVYKPKEHEPERVFFLGGEFLVVLDPAKGWQDVAYWSSKPKEHFDFKAYLATYGGLLPTVFTLPDGRVSFGHKAFSAGDTTVTGTHVYVSDGARMWHQDGKSFSSYDPAKGGKVAGDPPVWLTDWKREGWKLDGRASILVAAPAGLASSPLGMANGLLGLRVRDREKEIAGEPSVEVERIDGLRWSGSQTPFALVTWPGDAEPRLIQSESCDNKRFLGGDGPGVELSTASGEGLGKINEHAWAARGWGLAPPATFWDFTTPRDPAGSAALRAITLETARAILTAARTEVAAGGDEPGRALPATTAAIRAALPGVTDAVLLRGIVGVAERAGELAIQLTSLAEARAKEYADAGGSALVGHAAQMRRLAIALAAGRATKIADFEASPGCWLQHGRAMVALSLSPVATADERRAAREMAQALAGTVFAEDLGKLRMCEIEAPDDYEDPEDYNTLVIKSYEGSVFAIHASDDWAIELSTDGTFRVPPPWSIKGERKLQRGIGTAWVEGFLALPDAPLPWTAEIGAQLAEAAGLSVPEAALLYAGAPNVTDWAKDFLGKSKRELLGIKMGEADAARTTFKAIKTPDFHALVEAAVPGDPAQLVTGGFADGLARAWKKTYGKRVKLPQDLLAAAKKALPSLRDELAGYLAAFAGEDDAVFLKVDPRPLNELGGWKDHKGLDADTARELASVIAWLFVARPVGCPIRAGIPAVVEKLREVLADAKGVWKLDELYLDDEEAKDKARRQAILDLVGGKTIAMGKDGSEQALSASDDSALVIASYPSNLVAGFRPGKLEGAAKKKAEQLATAMFDPEMADSGDPLKDLALVTLLRSDAFAALGARAAETPVADGQFESNPRVSAPKLVTKVAKASGISEAAAALYLQILALAEPTQREVIAWNGWKPKEYAAAAAELVKKKLVVEGKRERAGRTIFIKGGYSKGDKQNLPMEDWKQPFYTALDRHLPTEPVHALFARAWKRVEDGEKP